MTRVPLNLRLRLRLTDSIRRLSRRCRLLPLAAAAALAGCASAPADLQEMTLAHERAIETHERQVILLNLLRAADGLPMAFTTIPTWNGSGGLQQGVGVSGQLFGHLMSNAGVNASVDISRNFNFTLSSLDNAEFTQAFFADLPLERFHVFASSADQSPELIYTLMVARIELDPGQPTMRQVANQADAANFPAFQQALARLLAAGLRTELAQRQRPLGPELTRDEALDLLKTHASSMKGQFELAPTALPGARPAYQVLVSERAWRFCLDTQRVAPDAALAVAPALACRAGGMQAGAPAAAGAGAVQALSIDLRSTRDVFRFLGRMVRQDLDAGHDGNTASRWDRVRGKAMLDVRRGRPAPGQRSVAAVNYQGQDYFVALDDGSQSAAVFEVLASLLAMNKVTGAIPASPGIVVR